MFRNAIKAKFISENLTYLLTMNDDVIGPYSLSIIDLKKTFEDDSL